MNDIAEHNAQTIDEMMLRMQRNHNIIQRLRKKLNSYTCEPRDSVCFDKLYDLRQSFKSFAIHQIRIMDLMDKNKIESKQLRPEIQKHLDRFKLLEQEIASYLLANNPYS